MTLGLLGYVPADQIPAFRPDVPSSSFAVETKRLLYQQLYKLDERDVVAKKEETEAEMKKREEWEKEVKRFNAIWEKELKKEDTEHEMNERAKEEADKRAGAEPWKPDEVGPLGNVGLSSYQFSPSSVAATAPSSPLLTRSPAMWTKLYP